METQYCIKTTEAQHRHDKASSASPAIDGRVHESSFNDPFADVEIGIPAHLRRPKPRSGKPIMAPKEATPEAPVIRKDPSVKETSAEERKNDKPQLHFYYPKIAEKLNPKQPDVTAAVILYNLKLWQNNKYKQTLIDSRRHSFRSLTDLQKDNHYFTRSAIHKALLRMEDTLGDQFKVRRDKEELWFSIGEETMGQMKEDRKLAFAPEDAVRLDSVKAAVILQNLKHCIIHFTDPKRDNEGNPYAELSPKKLAPILGYSEDTIARELKDMCSMRVLVRHPQFRSFYALGDGFIGAKPQNDKPAEVNNGTAEVNSQTADFHSKPAEVHTPTPDNAVLAIENEGLMTVPKATCINECVNESWNECFKGRDMTASASLGCQEILNSKGLQFLHDCSLVTLQKMRSSEAARVYNPVLVPDDELPYDVIDPYDLTYEYVVPEERTFNAWVDEQVKDMKDHWRIIYRLKVTKEDSKKLRKFFYDNPQVDYCALAELFGLLIHGPIVFTSKNEPWRWRERILNKSKTPTQFLRYLPQILFFMHSEGEEDYGSVQIEAPFNNLDYSYLGQIPRSEVVRLDPIFVYN